MVVTDGQTEELAALQAEALAWVRRLTSGEATTADAAALRQWCARSPAHAAALSEARQFWDAFGPAGRSLLDDERAAADRARIATASRRIGRRALLGGALAASAAGVMVVRPPLGLWPSVFELRADYRTATGEQRHVTVADGISVQMNTRTSLSVGAGSDARTVELIAGEASFNLAQQARATGAESEGLFRVVAAGGRTTTRGAKFDVRMTGATVCVTCLADDVRVELGAQAVTLSSRQQVVYGADGLRPVAAIDPAVVAAWQQGLIVCNMQPLAEVIDELNRYRAGHIVLLNADAGRLPVNGRFRIDRPDEALAQIEQAFGVRRRSLPGGVVLLS
ncbi:FecR family protein [Bradyrhizobium sp. 2TAF24]|uniref:FecR family protein n=1 Tax=Bradyrhizobium sp. 2TAF24 TaxID=3233011 RepID=UPI003F8DACBE